MKITEHVGDRWHHYIIHAFGGALLLNAVPHLIAGVPGSPFQTPFSAPGLSSSIVNVPWATFNIIVAYVLLFWASSFDVRRNRHIAPFGLGAFAWALSLAVGLGRLHGGLL